jgi:hypothetical protein
MTTSIKDTLVRRGEMKYLVDPLNNGNINSIRDVVVTRGTVEQKSILCDDSEFSIRDAIVDRYLNDEVLSSEMVGLAKEVSRERGLL